MNGKFLLLQNLKLLDIHYNKNKNKNNKNKNKLWAGNMVAWSRNDWAACALTEFNLHQQKREKPSWVFSSPVQNISVKHRPYISM